VPAGLLSIAPDVVNAIHIARGARSPVGWRMFGYVAGALTLAAGATTMLAYSGVSDGRSGQAVGAGTLALGVVDVALSVWGGLLPPVAVTPAVAVDAGGRLAPGAAVTLLHL
jgi:hypothetical protein